MFGPAVTAADTIRLAADPMAIAADSSIADLLDSRFAMRLLDPSASAAPAISQAFVLSEGDAASQS